MGIICLEPAVIEELWAKNQQIYYLVPALSQIPCLNHHYESFGEKIASKVLFTLVDLFSKACHAYQMIFPLFNPRM